MPLDERRIAGARAARKSETVIDGRCSSVVAVMPRC
jgi:hypothetical protein